MSDHVNLPTIMDIISEKCKDADIKEFKGLLNELIFSQNRLIFLLGYAKDVVIAYTKKLFSQRWEELRTSEIVNLESCMQCEKDFKDQRNKKDNEIITFHCKHSYHKLCCHMDDKNFICIICWENALKKIYDVNLKEKLLEKKSKMAIYGNVLKASEEAKLKENVMVDIAKMSLKKKRKEFIRSKNSKYVKILSAMG